MLLGEDPREVLQVPEGLVLVPEELVLQSLAVDLYVEFDRNQKQVWLGRARKVRARERVLRGVFHGSSADPAGHPAADAVAQSHTVAHHQGALEVATTRGSLREQ